MSELFDKDVILQLDLESKEEEKLTSFAIDLKRVLAGNCFDVLRTQSPLDNIKV